MRWRKKAPRTRAQASLMVRLGPIFGGDGDGEVVSLQYSWAVVVVNKMKQVNKEVVVGHIYPSSRSERRGSAVRDIA